MIGTLLVAALLTTPPPPAPPRPVALPKPSEKTLANGLRVIVVPKHDVPLVSAQVLVRTGSEEDTAQFGGLAKLTAGLLNQGTKTRTAEQIARGVEALGATLQADASWDASQVDVNVMSTNFGKAMEFVADIVRNPSFKEEDIERLRAQSIDGVRVALQQPMSLASYVAARVVFGETPYGQNASGTPESLERIQRAQIADFHQRYYTPDNSVLVIAGDVKAADAFGIAEKVFAGWKKREGVMGSVGTPPRAPAVKPRVVVVDMPEAGQAAVLVTRSGIARRNPSYFSALVANAVLGGGYSARLNQEIRIKRGLSYGAYSQFQMRSQAGPFLASTQTKNESAAEVAEILVDEVARLSTADVQESELTPRKAALIGEFGESLETSGGIVSRVAALALHDLNLDEIGRYISSVQGVTGGAVREFAAANLSGSEPSVVVVGDAKQFLEPLRKRFGEVEVIPVGDLKLEKAGLK